MFFSFDGVDGVGKSTQIRLLAEALRERGREVVTCRDPGGTALGERLRDILLNHHATPIHRRSEMLLFMASRAQLVEEVIRPALAEGKIVISDRYLLATVVYQAHAGGLSPDDVWRVGEVTVGGIMPKLTFLLDMPAARAASSPAAIARSNGGAGARIPGDESVKASSPKPAVSRIMSPSSTPISRSKPSTRKSCSTPICLILTPDL